MQGTLDNKCDTTMKQWRSTSSIIYLYTQNAKLFYRCLREDSSDNKDDVTGNEISAECSAEVDY
jgi:hypothetical protein